MRDSDEVVVLGIDHVGVAVPDLDAAIAFYQNVFGGRVLHRETNHEQGVEEAMVSFGPDAAPGGSGTRSVLQLLAPLTTESAIGRFLDRSGPGLQQLAYRVVDVRAAAGAARAAGMRVLYDEPRRGTAGSLVNFVHPKDTGGVLIELVQPPSATTDGAASAAATTEDGTMSR